MTTGMYLFKPTIPLSFFIKHFLHLIIICINISKAGNFNMFLLKSRSIFMIENVRNFHGTCYLTLRKFKCKDLTIKVHIAQMDGKLKYK